MTTEHTTEEINERLQKLNDAHRILNWLEVHPDVPLPIAVDWQFEITSLNTKEEAEMLAKEFGTCEKVYAGDMFYLQKKFGSVPLRAIFFRNQVCERIVTGTEKIPETVIPARVVETVEWKCSPLLAEAAA